MQEIVVLSTMRFTDELLEKLRAISPQLVVEQRTCHNAEEVEQALEDAVEVLYTFYLPADLSRALKLNGCKCMLLGLMVFWIILS